jgi:hypothetical protein
MRVTNRFASTAYMGRPAGEIVMSVRFSDDPMRGIEFRVSRVAARPERSVRHEHW